MEASAYSPSGVMSGLPSNHLLKAYTSMTSLTTAARFVLDNLNQNNDAGNQYIVVLGLPKSIRTHLNEDKNALDGIGFRFMFEDAVGLIKIVPSYAHDATTRKVSQTMTIKMVGMGVSEDDIGWAATTTYRSPIGQKGKQGDDIFLPPPRQGLHGQPPSWPTLVIESGVSESLPKLHDDVKWWFENSRGEVRIVIVMAIRRASRTIIFEQWQLAPPGQPVTPAVIQNLQQMSPPPIPPLVQQPPVNQHRYIAQTVTITPTTATGDVPISLSFQAIFDRLPNGNETDILFNAQTLVSFAKYL